MTFRVPPNKVDLGDGVHLPPGDYAGYVVEGVVHLHGRPCPYLAKAMLPLSRDFLEKLGLAFQSRDLIEIDMNVVPHVKKGDIQVL